MGKCKYCGRSAGILRYEHPECRPMPSSWKILESEQTGPAREKGLRLKQLEARVKKREILVANRKRKQALPTAAPERKNDQQAKRIAFRNSPEHALIEKFEYRFGLDASDEQYEKLRKTLASKGWQYSIGRLKSYVRGQAERSKKNSVLALVATDGARTFDDFVENFVINCNWKSGSEVKIFESFLKSRRLLRKIDRNSLNAIFAKVDEKLEISAFEAQLNRQERLISISEIDQLGGFEFEAFLKSLFSKMGYEVIQTKLSGDQGADLLVVKFNEKTVIQAKRFGGKVGNKAVQEVVASITFYGADRGMVITNSSFTPAAVDLAKANRIQLVDKVGLERLIDSYW